MLGVTGAAVVVLVEGVSDQVAVERLAARRGIDLARRGAVVLAVNGAQAVGKVVRTVREQSPGARVAGLCDLAEEPDVRRSLERAGLGPVPDRAALEALGFYTCDADLEDELIRAVGADGVLDVLARHGALASFRTFQKQPHWRGRPVASQLRRFFGSSAGKIRYAGPLVDALDLDRAPRSLDHVLALV